MYFKVIVLLALCVGLYTAQEPQIIDFTYTRRLQQANYAVGKKNQIKIEPDVKQQESYHFPEVCSLEAELNYGTQSQGDVEESSVLENPLDKLQDKILDLLKLNEEIKSSRSYISEISKHLDMNEHHSIIKKFKNQLSQLAKRESQLESTKLKIQNLTATLNSMINEYNSNPKNHQLKAVSLNFQIQNYNSKINYLRALKVTSINKAALQPHTNFTDFFAKLKNDLNNESQELEFIDTYFQNMSHLSYLKDTANSLKDNIEVDKINIEYKRSCEAKRNSYTSKSSTPSQIKETLEDLRQKKKQFGKTNNKYCEGVALKLQMQIKRLLKAINWTFVCADGLKDLIANREAQIQKLKQINDAINSFEQGGYDTYQEKYSRTQEIIKRKLFQIKDFQIDEYSHDPARLDQLIEQAQRGKETSEEELRSLPQQTTKNHNFDSIKQLADQIKKEKAKFCQNYEPYEKEVRKLWFHIYRYQQSERYQSKMREDLLREIQKLKDLEESYKQQSEVVIGAIERNYEK